jgi:cation:H+ antiporter
MLLDVGLLLAGLVVLYFGAEWLIRGASSVAIGMGIRPLVVGLTVVALGTSFPEFVTNILAAFRGEAGHGLAIGNILGSNIANVGLILGLTALLAPMAVSASTLKREFPIMLGIQVVFCGLAWDGTISRIDGGILLLILTGFMIYLVRDTRRAGLSPDQELASPALAQTAWRRVALVGGGVIGLALGAHLMVQGAVNIAESFGISTVIIGLTIVAIGTSLPELATSLLAVAQKQADFSLGNVIGSNLLNVLFVVGLIALITPLSISTEVLRMHFPVMLVFCASIGLAWFSHRLGRVHGVLLLGAYVGYMAYLIVPLL